MQAWLKLSSVLWWVLMTSIVCGQERNAIPFSISKATKVEDKGDDDLIDFSISKQIPVVEDDGDLIDFSVHKIASIPRELPKPIVPEVEKAQARAVNRVLVFHHTKAWTESKVVIKAIKVCKNGKCWIENRRVTERVEHDPVDSTRFLQELGKLKQWKCAPDVDAHFVPIDVDNPSNTELVKEFKVEKQQLPLLVKETDGKVRQSAKGMSGVKASEWWNSTFVPKSSNIEPKQEAIFYRDDHDKWTYPGNIRHHLMDPKFPHHLPKAVIDTWTDKQCENWHNWHHEVLSGHKPISKPLSSVQSKQTHTLSLGYPKGSREAQIANFANHIAHQVARAPPSQQSFGSNSKKAAKELKKWKSKERERIRKEVRRQVWNKYATFDPFTWWSILSIVWQICSLIFRQYGLN